VEKREDHSNTGTIGARHDQRKIYEVIGFGQRQGVEIPLWVRR